MQNKEGIKGRFWFLDNDLREGVNVRPDKSGRAILTILRHLKRIEEVGFAGCQIPRGEGW